MKKNKHAASGTNVTNLTGFVALALAVAVAVVVDDVENRGHQS